MTPPLYIAMRFLTHRKRALLLSLSGVVFGVAIFICTQAQTQGFTRYFIDSTIGSNGALVVKSRFRPLYEPLMVSAKASNGEVGRRQYFEGIAIANEIMRVSRQFSNVVSCSPVLRGTLTARAGFQNATIDLYGINPGLHAQTTDILQKLISGKYDDFRNNTSSIIIGSRLAEDLLHAGVGDTVQLLAPNGEYWRFTVAAIARAGIGSIDSTRIYCHARIAQALLQQSTGALIGCLLGALMTWGVSHIPIRLRGLLYTNHFLVTWDWRHYVFATLLALLAVFIASYVPARRAAELPPVVTIRGSR